MDQIDKKIIALLHKNARITVAQISRNIALSQPSVKERILRLEEQGIITGYHAKLSPEKIDKHTTAFVLLKTNQCNKFLPFSKQSPEIVELYRMGGEYNYLLKIWTESNETLTLFLQKLSNFGFSQTMIVMKTEFDLKLPISDPVSFKV
ncbi:Lrp/AsnC family transcriptional regulator [Shimazuella kribbensis]|uniref:Lrp/AsnC family transcriptional regulator n=1 Tax=Shimazuella kribbensis TaxID=139808 RepID=UPI000400C6DD|nr:winged helix-turn-helix transcriptional regulator [Shimazuella kribbensis]